MLKRILDWITKKFRIIFKKNSKEKEKNNIKYCEYYLERPKPFGSGRYTCFWLELMWIETRFVDFELRYKPVYRCLRGVTDRKCIHAVDDNE